MKILILAFGAILLATSITYADADDACHIGGMGGMMYGGYGTGTMIFSWITYILVIGLIVAGIYWLIKSANRKK